MKNLALRIVIFSISFLVSIISLASYPPQGYKMVFLLPLTYGLLILILPSITRFMIKNAGLLIFNIVTFVRYVILVLVGVLTDFSIWRGIPPGSTYLKSAILVMFIEMITVFIFIQIISKRYYSSTKMQVSNERVINKNINSFILNLFILLGIISVILFPEIISKLRFVTNLDDFTEYQRNDFPLFGLFELLFNIARILVVLSIIVYWKKKHELTGKFKYVFYSIGISLLNLLIVTGLSRFSILISAVAILYFLAKLFNKHKKLIFSSLMTGIIFSVTIVSLYKFFGRSENNSSNYNDLAWWSDTLQMYFSGPKNVAIALTMNDRFDINIVIQILVDLFSSVAGIAGILHPNFSTVGLYNLTYYGSTVSVDQIVPIVGQGFFYFGYIGSFIPSIIAVWLMMKFDKKAALTNNPYSSYAYYFIATWFGALMMVNWTILFSHFINTFVLLMIIIKVNNRFILKNKK
ncbi:O-antigen ligase [Fictibacillus sp. B-59209]|uniref:O-antigen polymerase n=1 Tax=Fictibacillus sp. B-59209 TaxID=3024873 RepID=UPI002E1D24A4|nr:O-antigen ligase [Fictibacillus sp. B-59209]